MEHKDYLGNILNIGDDVLVRENSKDTTFRQAKIIDLKDNNYCFATVRIEYLDDRIYSNIPYYHIGDKGIELKFSRKHPKVWVDRHRIIKYDGDIE